MAIQDRDKILREAKERARLFRLAHPDIISERKRKFYIKHKEKIQAYKKAYYLRNSDKEKNRASRWYYGNLDRAKSRRHAYKPRRNEQAKKRFWENRSFRIQNALRCRLYNSIKGNSRSKRADQILGCSIHDFMIYIESKFEPGMSWENYGTWELDHIMPCSLFDFTKEEHQHLCFHFSNYQPLWASENIKKYNKIVHPKGLIKPC